MIQTEIYRLKSLLEMFLGKSKNELDESYQLQFPCPRCIENKGIGEAKKYNLEINLKKGLFNCWSCGEVDDSMHGSIHKLIKTYGNDDILKEYKEIVSALQQSELYKFKFKNNEFSIGVQNSDGTKIKLPSTYQRFNENYNEYAFNYLAKRGITNDIISKYEIGYTSYESDNKLLSNRIIIPSFDSENELNYWTGRIFLDTKTKFKYFNPQIDRKDIIFNEKHIQWDADITLVEGPFDHIVVPNSIPMLGKKINYNFKLYHALKNNAKANVNIFLDGDALENAKELYKLLNHDNLYGKIRIIEVNHDLDPSVIFEKYGKNGISKCLASSYKISDFLL